MRDFPLRVAHMKEIYLDFAASHPALPVVQERIAEYISMCGNPSSSHKAGSEMRGLIDAARANILDSLGAKNDSELYFTGSGTEANNFAIWGAMLAKEYSAPNVVVHAGEHPSVAATAKALAPKGVEVRTFSATDGIIDIAKAAELIDNSTVLVSCMAVSNETGAIFDTKSLFSATRKNNHKVICHTDASQAYMKMPLSMTSTSADMMTLSAHKIGATHGVGALVVRRELVRAKRIVPILHGSGQQGGMRSGTENAPAVGCFGVAVEELAPLIAGNHAKVATLREMLLTGLPHEVVPIVPKEYIPHIIGLALPKIKGETMQNALSARGIYVSAGAACSEKSKGNPALTDFGLTREQAECTIRVSLSASVAEANIAMFLSVLDDELGRLVRIK